MKNIVPLTLASLLFLCFFIGSLMVAGPGSAYAQQDWKQEYAEVCSRTQDAVVLSDTVLKGYIARCDRLLERIDGPDGLQTPTERKVYRKRLKMCRDLYDFALQQKGKEE